MKSTTIIQFIHKQKFANSLNQKQDCEIILGVEVVVIITTS